MEEEDYIDAKKSSARRITEKPSMMSVGQHDDDN